MNPKRLSLSLTRKRKSWLLPATSASGLNRLRLTNLTLPSNING